MKTLTLVCGAMLLMLTGCSDRDSGPKEVSAFRPRAAVMQDEYKTEVAWKIEQVRYNLGELEQATDLSGMTTTILTLRTGLDVISRRSLPQKEAEIRIMELQTSLSLAQAAALEFRRSACDAELRKAEDDIARLIDSGFPQTNPEMLKHVQNSFETILAGFYEKQYVECLRNAKELTSKTQSLLASRR